MAHRTQGCEVFEVAATNGCRRISSSFGWPNGVSSSGAACPQHPKAAEWPVPSSLPTPRSTHCGTSALRTIGHVDLEQSEIRVSQSLAYQRGDGPTLGPPKSDSAHRTVAIPVEISERLASLIDEFANASQLDSLIFTSVKGIPLLNRYFAPYWRRARTAVHLEDVRFHDLRHLAGTEAASAGASLREVMARMGHSSSDASLRYLKASEARDREVSDAIGKRMRMAQR